MLHISGSSQRLKAVHSVGQALLVTAIVLGGFHNFTDSEDHPTTLMVLVETHNMKLRAGNLQKLIEDKDFWRNDMKRISVAAVR